VNGIGASQDTLAGGRGDDRLDGGADGLDAATWAPDT
jgi:hypothetical protein